jgi:hypothetical protein
MRGREWESWCARQGKIQKAEGALIDFTYCFLHERRTDKCTKSRHFARMAPRIFLTRFLFSTTSQPRFYFGRELMSRNNNNKKQRRESEGSHWRLRLLNTHIVHSYSTRGK